MTVPVSERATYGGFVDAAVGHVAAATVGLALGPMSGPTAAIEAVAAYRRLLRTIYAHTRALFGGSHRFDVIAASATPDPRDAAALKLVRGLNRFARLRRQVPCTVEGPGVAWEQAAICLHVAADLLATHHDPQGKARTPEALQLEEPSVRAAGMAGIGALAGIVLGAERDLGLRAGQAGMTWKEVDRLLPDLSSLRDSARALAAPVEPGPARCSLRALTLARPGVRIDDSIVELGDRLLRLRRVAWQLTREPHVGIGTLSDFAAAAVTFHAHAFAHVRPQNASSVNGLSGDDMDRRLPVARAAWSQVHMQSREMRTATPCAGVVRADTLAIRELCRLLMPLDPAGNRSVDAELRATINGGARAFCEIAGYNARVLAELHATGQLYQSARNLSGAEVTEDPYLVVAKLRGDIIRVPHSQVESLAQSYASARTATSTNVCSPGRHATQVVTRALAVAPTLYHAMIGARFAHVVHTPDYTARCQTSEGSRC